MKFKPGSGEKHDFFLSEKALVFLLLSFAVSLRLPHLPMPLLDAHSWRQTQTAMFARNFYRHGMNIFLPELDWNGNRPGYTESEFQLYPYLVAVIYKLTGIHEAAGRSVSLIFFIGSSFFLYKWLRRHLDVPWAAIGLSFYITSPLGLFFSTAFMPESCMLFFLVVSAYYFDALLAKKSKRNIAFFGISTCFMLLVKIPTLFMGIAYAIILILREKKFYKNRMWWLLFFSILLPVIAWYFYAYHLGQSTGMTENIWSIGKDKWGNLEHWTNSRFYSILFARITEQILTPYGFFLAALGFFKMRSKALLFYAILGAVVIYFFVVAFGNMVHNYYQLPVSVPLSFFVAEGAEIIGRALGSKRMLPFFLLLSLIYGFSVQRSVKPFYAQQTHFLLAGKYVKKHTKPKALILTVDYSYPEVLYYADRRGFHLNPKESSPSAVKIFQERGARALVFTPGFWLSSLPDWKSALEKMHCPKKTKDFVFCWLE